MNYNLRWGQDDVAAKRNTDGTNLTGFRSTKLSAAVVLTPP